MHGFSLCLGCMRENFWKKHFFFLIFRFFFSLFLLVMFVCECFFCLIYFCYVRYWSRFYAVCNVIEIWLWWIVFLCYCFPFIHSSFVSLAQGILEIRGPLSLSQMYGAWHGSVLNCFQLDQHDPRQLQVHVGNDGHVLPIAERYLPISFWSQQKR